MVVGGVSCCDDDGGGYGVLFFFFWHGGIRFAPAFPSPGYCVVGFAPFTMMLVKNEIYVDQEEQIVFLFHLASSFLFFYLLFSVSLSLFAFHSRALYTCIGFSSLDMCTVTLVLGFSSFFQFASLS